MARIEPIRPDQAEGRLRSLLEASRAKRGHGWNTIDTLGHNEHVLALALEMQRHLAKAGLSQIEREIVAIETAHANGCLYCLAAHAYSAAEAGLDADEIARLHRGEISPTPDIAHLQRLTRRLLETRGMLSDAELSAARAGGFTEARLLAILAEIAFYTLMNSLNRLAGTELDAFLSDT